MSAFESKADIGRNLAKCLLMTLNGHERLTIAAVHQNVATGDDPAHARAQLGHYDTRRTAQLLEQLHRID